MPPCPAPLFNPPLLPLIHTHIYIYYQINYIIYLLYYIIFSSLDTTTNARLSTTTKPTKQEIFNEQRRIKPIKPYTPLTREEAMTVLSSLPLGFPSTEDDDVDKLAKALRQIYQYDLHDLQQTVNETIAIAQEFTANPVTDKRLGKVGR